MEQNGICDLLCEHVQTALQAHLGTRFLQILSNGGEQPSISATVIPTRKLKVHGAYTIWFFTEGARVEFIGILIRFYYYSDPHFPQNMIDSLCGA
jgi:hypothetical protein